MPIHLTQGAKIKVKNGEVKIKGQVQASGDKRNILMLVKNIACVQDVHTGGLCIQCNDGKALNLAQDMIATLPCDVSSGITVTISNGVITLSGTVPTKLMKKTARRAVEVVDCVSRVENCLKVTPPKTAAGCDTTTDARLQSDVEAALRSILPCSELAAVKAEVKNQVVTLTGGVIGSPEYIVNFVKSIKCVKAVENHLRSFALACTSGAIGCRTMDGESYCCYGCRRCPNIN